MLTMFRNPWGKIKKGNWEGGTSNIPSRKYVLGHVGTNSYQLGPMEARSGRLRFKRS